MVDTGPWTEPGIWFKESVFCLHTLVLLWFLSAKHYFKQWESAEKECRENLSCSGGS